MNTRSSQAAPLSLVELPASGSGEGGTQMVKAQWRFHDTKIIDVVFHAPGPEGRVVCLPAAWVFRLEFQLESACEWGAA